MTLKLELHDKYRAWATEQAEHHGLPSPESYLRLIIQFAWQHYQLKSEERHGS